MTDVANVADTGGAMDNTPVASVPALGEGATSIREAARALSSYRWGKNKDSEAPSGAEAAAPVEPEQNSASEAEAAPVEGQPSGETEAIEPALEPSIEPPGSWTKEAKERWASLPRDTQEYLAQREQERDRDLRTRQNEAAEKLKGLTAKEQQAEQVRQQYEQALPALLQTLQQQQQGEFHDIRTMADVERLAREDWPRYALWDAQQKKIAAVQNEVKAAQERQAQEYHAKWSEFAKREDELFISKAPEFADKAQFAKVQDAAVGVLKDIGFSEDELSGLWNGQASMSLRDHRVQLLIRDGIRLREMQTAAKNAVAKKPVPQVQRPGVAQAPGAQRDAEIQALTQKLDKTGNLKDAAKLMAARRAAARR